MFNILKYHYSNQQTVYNNLVSIILALVHTAYCLLCQTSSQRGSPCHSTTDREEKFHCTSLTLLIIMGISPQTGQALESAAADPSI